MNTPRLALAALLSAFGAAASFAQPLAQNPTPVVNGPAGPGECLVGLGSCGAGPGFSMDPATEGALVGLGAPITPNALPSPTRINVPKASAQPGPDETDGVAALGVGIGGIINPPGGLVAAKTAPAAAGPATVGAAFGGAIDAGGITASLPAVGSAGPFSFRKVEKAAAAAAALEKDVPAPDVKLAPGDDNLAPGTMRAASNGR
jgi:hypothetical protein